MNRLESTLFSETHPEAFLEDLLEQNPDVLFDGESILYIGRQVNTEVGVIDLLGLDKNGNVVIVELKKGPAPRDIIAQALEYAAWVASQPEERIYRIAESYFNKNNIAQPLQEKFKEVFEEEEPTWEMPSLNSRQVIVLVGENISPRVERVARYLRDAGVDIRCVEFSYYRLGSEQFLDFEIKVGEEVSPPPDGEVGVETLIARCGPEIRPLFDRLWQAINELAVFELEVGKKSARCNIRVSKRPQSLFHISPAQDHILIYLHRLVLQHFLEPSELARILEERLGPWPGGYQAPKGSVRFRLYKGENEKLEKFLEILKQEIVRRLQKVA